MSQWNAIPFFAHIAGLSANRVPRFADASREMTVSPTPSSRCKRVGPYPRALRPSVVLRKATALTILFDPLRGYQITLADKSLVWISSAEVHRIDFEEVTKNWWERFLESATDLPPTSATRIMRVSPNYASKKGVLDQELHSPAPTDTARSRTASAAKSGASRTSSASMSGYSANMPSI
jgi:hypothetical protein